jgi:acyl-CoA thioesterase
MSEFEQDTAVTEVGPGLWRGEIAPGWRIGTVSNGGYVLAIAGRVLSQALPHNEPFNAHIMYTAPTEIGPIDCQVEVLREGGSTTFASVTMRQNGQVKAHVSAAYSDLGKLKGESFTRVERPQITPWEEVDPIKEHGIELRQRVAQRYASGGEVFKRGEPDSSGVFNGWLNFVDGTDPDPLSLLLFADAMAPPVFTVYGVLQWVPTVELTVSVRARPAPGPLQVRFSSRHMTDGVVEEDGELWDSTGKLVALSRQTSKVRVIPS